jgi:hypothetical protein
MNAEGVEVPLTPDEIEDLRQMLHSPGYRVLLRMMDGKIMALNFAAQMLGKMDPHHPDLGKSFLRANVAEEFREHVNSEVMRVVNLKQNDSVEPATERDAILGMLEHEPIPQTVRQPAIFTGTGLESKFRR